MKKLNTNFKNQRGNVGWIFAALVFANLSYAKPQKQLQLTNFYSLYAQKSSLSETIDRIKKMEQLRVSAQGSLEALMKRGSNIDLEIRYAELIVQRGKDLEQFALEVEFAGDSKQSKKLKDESHSLMRKGLSLHSGILPRAKNHPLIPKVYLGMARTEYSLGRKSASLENARLGLRTLKNQKNKMQETELQLLIVEADSAFDLSKAIEAKSAYNRALNIAEKNSIEQSYIFYKSAWVEYNLKDSELAIDYIDKLFKSASDKYSLKQEAVMDYSIFVADLPRKYIEDKLGGFAGVDRYLNTYSDSNASETALKRMSNLFSSNGRRKDAIELQEYLISKNPSDPKNYERALSIVEWTHLLADKTQLTDRYFWLLETYGPKSKWYRDQAQAPQIQKESYDRIESSVRKYANDLHNKNSKETSAEVKAKNEVAISKLYDAHIDSFNRETDVPSAEIGRVHYYRAEIHRSKKEWVSAGTRYDSYLKILGLVPKNQVGKIDEKLSQDAVWGSVFVWAKAVEKDSSNSPSLMAAADRFLVANPKDPKAPQVLLDAAYVEQKSGQIPSALNRLGKLVQNYPKTSQAQIAVDTILDILNKENDWVNLAQNARKYLDTLSAWSLPQDKQKMTASLNKILSQTEAKACESLSNIVDRKLEAALCYERFAKGFSKDAQAPKALLLSAELYDSLKDPTAAVGALEKLVANYPNSEFANRGFSRLANVYERAFEFEKAMGIYETLLTKNDNLKDREKILARHLDLLDRMGEAQRFEKWLSHKLTPEVLRSELRARSRSDELTTLRTEEARMGWKDGKLASSAARGVQEKLEKELAAGRISIEREMELRRIRGLELKYKNQFDKADSEWLAGLKIFWKAKDRTPSHWELAAKIRLEQAALWENAFRSTSIIKNPAKKAELFKKLENWYAEVIEMKAPVTALAALWKSAELNMAFADDVRNSPIPPELLVAGMESQKQAYERLVLEKTEPLKKKAVNIVEKIAVKAKEWKVISPVVLTSLRMTSQLRSGVELPGTLVSVEEKDVLQFPWAELPRWVELSDDQSKWEEWNFTESQLKAALRNEKGRSASRRAAYVLFARSLDTKKYDLEKWVKTFNEKAGIQLRIQAYIQSGNYSRSALYLEQYESFYGQDSFAEFQWGQIEWSRGNYSNAYARWVRPVYTLSRSDFKNQYWLEGWGFMLDEMIEGWPTQARRREIFSKLYPLAKKPEEKVLLAKLCIDGAAECEKEFKDPGNLLVMIDQEISKVPFQNYSFSDEKSLWSVKQQALSELVSRQSVIAKKTDDLKLARKALSSYYDLIDRSESSSVVRAGYSVLKNKVDLKQDVLDREAKNRVLAVKEKTNDSN